MSARARSDPLPSFGAVTSASKEMMRKNLYILDISSQLESKAKELRAFAEKFKQLQKDSEFELKLLRTQLVATEAQLAATRSQALDEAESHRLHLLAARDAQRAAEHQTAQAVESLEHERWRRRQLQPEAAVQAPPQPRDVEEEVLQSPDLLMHIMRKVPLADAGAVLLTCKLWAAALQGAGRFPFNADSTLLLFDLHQDPMPLTQPSKALQFNWGAAVSTVSEITALCFKRRLEPNHTFRILSQTRNLQILRLWDRGVGPSGAQAIAQTFPSLQSLTILQLSKNNLGPEGMAALAQSLPALTELRSMALFDNGVGVEGARALGSVLPSMQSLTWLRLGANALGLQGVALLTPALQSLPRLGELGMERNGLGDEGATLLLKDWAHRKELTRIDLHDNDVTEVGKAAVPETWKETACTPRLAPPVRMNW